jgi:lipopolysaccharide biosynthesis regulator YciM
MHLGTSKEAYLDNFLPGYDSPLFSIILAIFILLAIVLVTYGWSLYLQQRKKSQLMEFLEQFDSASCVLEGSDIPFDESMSKPLLLLAKAFETSGEYYKSISIYLYLIKSGQSGELLEQLGKIYLRAGFLERAENIFLQILSKEPRNIPVLYQLGAVYELLQNYDKAIETLEPLETLGEEIGMLKVFWQFEKLQQERDLSKEEKRVALLQMLRDEPSLYRLIIATLFHLDSETGWQHLEKEKLKETLDLLWYLPASQLDFDIIRSDSRLTKIYFARGDISQIDPSILEKRSDIVSIDILVAARYAGEQRGDLSFSYLCDKCKQSFPIAFKRCPNCLAINSAQLEEQIAKHEETDYSLF